MNKFLLGIISWLLKNAMIGLDSIALLANYLGWFLSNLCLIKISRFVVTI